MGAEALINAREEKAQELSELKEKFSDESRLLTDEEEERFDELKSDIEGLDRQIEKFEEADELLDNHPSNSGGSGHLEVDGDPNKPSAQAGNSESVFESLDEFVRDVLVFEKEGKRTNKFEKYAQTTDSGSSGGYLVPEDFRDELLRVEPEEAALSPRVRMFDANDRNPDASVKVPALDQTGTSATDMYGGVTVSWTGEGNKKSETSTNFLEDQLNPEELAAFIDVSEKMLRNAGPNSDIFENLLRQAAIAEEDNTFIEGDGTAKPLGVVNGQATATVSRDTSDQINPTDTDSMINKILPQANNLVWLASVDARGQIAGLNDSGERLFHRNLAEGQPSTLYGVPIFFNSRLPSLGNRGDLILASGDGYIAKRGFGPSIAISTDAEFKSAIATIRLIHNVDGMPWLQDTVTMEDGSTELSYFVELN